MINGDRPKLAPNANLEPERSVLHALGAASDAQWLACFTAGAQTRPSATGIRGMSIQTTVNVHRHLIERIEQAAEERACSLLL
jgi:hypothetical protein